MSTIFSVGSLTAQFKEQLTVVIWTLKESIDLLKGPDLYDAQISIFTLRKRKTTHVIGSVETEVRRRPKYTEHINTRITVKLYR